MAKNALNSTRANNFSEWYQEIIARAELADNSVVRGCMVMRPYGYAIWENIQRILNDKIRENDVQNAYFPLLIPLEFLEKEAEHVEGFAKECAVVTHSRLKKENGKLIPDGKLENPYIIRPTSETIIGDSFSKWINSYRDLPMKINQWANVMRWEMRTRMFLRTSEFLWQEGHNVFSSQKEAENDALKMQDMYNDFMVNYLAIDGFKGKKTDDEKFPGASATYTIESMMQDGKALQSCTSHDLGQNFTIASNIKFLNERGEEQFGYSTSWGMTTRIIGALIMSHADDDGLVLPPKIAPHSVVIIPVINDEERRDEIMEYCEQVKKRIGAGALIDKSYASASDKKWNWIRKGAPIKMELGTKEVEEKSVFFTLRHKIMEKCSLSLSEFVEKKEGLLSEMQDYLLEKNRNMHMNNLHEIHSAKELESMFSKKSAFGFAVISDNLYEDENINVVMKKYSLSYRCITGDGIIIGRSY